MILIRAVKCGKCNVFEVFLREMGFDFDHMILRHRVENFYLRQGEHGHQNRNRVILQAII